MAPGMPEMVWVDFEASGVHGEVEPVVPLEMGLVVTDSSGYEISSFVSLILEPGWMQHLNRATPLVQRMHASSGLTEELADLASSFVIPEVYREYSPSSVAEKALSWLDRIPFGAVSLNKLPMTGSSVHYDRRIMQDWMPNLNSWFHYRNLDISTLKGACKLTNPELYKKLPLPVTKKHRPLEDIRTSIREYQWYLQNFLFVEGDSRW